MCGRNFLQNVIQNNQNVLSVQLVVYAATRCGKIYMTGLNQCPLKIVSACQLKPELKQFLYIGIK